MFVCVCVCVQTETFSSPFMVRSARRKHASLALPSHSHLTMARPGGGGGIASPSPEASSSSPRAHHTATPKASPKMLFRSKIPKKVSSVMDQKAPPPRAVGGWEAVPLTGFHPPRVTRSPFGSSQRIPDISKPELAATKLRVELSRLRLEHVCPYEGLDVMDMWTDHDTGGDKVVHTALAETNTAAAASTSVFTQDAAACRLHNLRKGPALPTALHRPDVLRMTDFDSLFGVGGDSAQILPKERAAALWREIGPSVSPETFHGGHIEEGLPIMKRYHCSGGGCQGHLPLSGFEPTERDG